MRDLQKQGQKEVVRHEKRGQQPEALEQFQQIYQHSQGQIKHSEFVADQRQKLLERQFEWQAVQSHLNALQMVEQPFSVQKVDSPLL